MATKAEIRKYLLPKKVSKLQDNITWEDVLFTLDPVNGYITEEQLRRITNNLLRKDYSNVGKIIVKALNKKIEDDATVIINEYLSNSSLDLEELGDVLL